MQFITSWEQKGIIKGRSEGHIKGELIALRETLLDLLRVKFSEVPSTIAQQVEAISSNVKIYPILVIGQKGPLKSREKTL